MDHPPRRIRGLVVNHRRVESLGVLCEHVPGESRGPTLDFSLVEFANLTSGERLILHDDRGWSQSGNSYGGQGERDPWVSVTVESLVLGIYNTLLPEAVFEHDNHDWDRLASLLADHEIEVSVDDLRRLGYVVEFGPNLLANLSDTEAQKAPLSVDWSQVEADLEAQNPNRP